MNNKIMNFGGHIKELHRRVVWVSYIVVLGVSIGLIFAGKWDAIRIYMQVSVAMGLCLALPFIMYHLWAFAKPGLRTEEQKGIFVYIPATIVFFLVGFSFAYFITFPMVFHFMSVVTSEIGIDETYLNTFIHV